MARELHPNHQELENLLKAAFEPLYLEILDESHMHARGTGSHYKVIMADPSFEGLGLVQRQRKVFAVTKGLFPERIHALSLKLYTPAEWEQNPTVIASPKCAGHHPD